MALVGRERDLAVLRQELAVVLEGRAASRGRAVLLTGRRRVGKSRLAQEFCDQSGLRSVVFQASRGRQPRLERIDFLAAAATAATAAGDEATGWPAVDPGDWLSALRLVANALPTEAATIVVIDEVPWLVAMDPEFEGALQTAWDRHFSAKPVLLLLIGSDVSVMESLQDHDRPFFGRAATRAVQPLDVHAVRRITRTTSADAIDAWLVTGGFPEIVTSWPQGGDVGAFLADSLAHPLSPLLVSAELTLLGEFPQSGLARLVLEAIGSGERSFGAVAARVGAGQAVASGSLSPVLKTLERKKVVAVDAPLSTRADTRNRRYRIADPYLRFWLAFGPKAVALSERGLADQAVRSVLDSWPTWRGRAVEPVVRDCVARLAPALWPDAVHVGGWWNRANNPEIDLVGADKTPVAGQVVFVGSIKWHERAPFDRHDAQALVRDAAFVPGAESAHLVAAARCGFEGQLPLAHQWDADDLVSAWE